MLYTESLEDVRSRAVATLEPGGNSRNYLLIKFVGEKLVRSIRAPP